jgi:hypothetical protein
MNAKITYFYALTNCCEPMLWSVDPYPDPHGSALTWLPGSGSGSAFRRKAGSSSALKLADPQHGCDQILVEFMSIDDSPQMLTTDPAA